MIQQPKEQYHSILDAYRTLGRFVSGKIALSQTQPISLAVPTNNSYKIYSNSLAIKVVSPPLEGDVENVLCFNQYSYVKLSNGKVLKMKYHHIVREWNVRDEVDVEVKTLGKKLKTSQMNQNTIVEKNNLSYPATMFKFQDLLILGQSNKVFIIDDDKNYALKQHLQETNPIIDTFQIGFSMISMVHPVTYVNKLLVYNHEQVQLINAISKKVLYSFPNLIKYLKGNQSEQSVAAEQRRIVTIQSSKLVNIVAIGLNDGEILIFNLKKDEIVFKMKLKREPTVIAFSDEHALMATADSQGNVVLWDLEKKKILYKFQESIKGPIDSLVFIPGQPILTCGSSDQNCIKQLRINLEDSRILTLFRQRVGITLPINQIKLLNNSEIMLSSKTESMFSSLYSHSNNYKINRVLDSRDYLHIISRHFSVQVFKNQTMEKSFNIHESALIGKISLSSKYYIIATRTRLVKLGVSDVEIKITGIVDIALFNEHFIFVFTELDVLVLDFPTFSLVKELKIGKCIRSTINQFGNLLSFYQHDSQKIVIFDMERLQIAREYQYDSEFKQLSEPSCLCLTSDNKYLLSSHPKTQSLCIWSIIHNNLFKQFKTDQPIIDMCFSPDNQFFMSVFEDQRQINIWNNYIGKISSNREQQDLKFSVQINYMQSDFRETLCSNLQKNSENYNQMKQMEAETEGGVGQLDDVLDRIQDSQGDNIPNYSFDIPQQRWLPLIYYDQIKERNTIESDKPVSMPFFLDFDNIDQEKKKIQKQAKQDILNKKKQKQDSIDKHLKGSGQGNTHTISLTNDSTKDQCHQCLKNLECLSIAQIDYQLRTFLLNSTNKQPILRLFKVVFANDGANHSADIAEEFKNIIFHRCLDLLGTDIFDCDSETRDVLTELLDQYGNRLKVQKEKMDKCIAIVEKLI